MGRPQQMDKPEDLPKLLLVNSNFGEKVSERQKFSAVYFPRVLNINQMRAFVSWSGGKDCMLALYRELKHMNLEISYLINMCDIDGEHSRSHGLKKSLIKQQAEAIGIPIIQAETDFNNYETNLKEVIQKLKIEGISAGIFGDIYLKVHRDWIERVCSDLDIATVFPLWGCDTSHLLKEFIDEGFKAFTVAVNSDKLGKEWLGRELNSYFYSEITKLNNIDPCAENGEYHTFVYDGPIFRYNVGFTKGPTSLRDNHFFLDLV